MSEKKTPISGADSYRKIGEYWDNHDLSEVWDKTQPVEFEQAQKPLVERRRSGELMEKLLRIKIEGPEDFSESFDRDTE